MVQSEQSRKQVPFSVNLRPGEFTIGLYKPFRKWQMVFREFLRLRQLVLSIRWTSYNFSVLLLCMIINIQTIAKTSPAEKKADCVKVCSKKMISKELLLSVFYAIL